MRQHKLDGLIKAKFVTIRHYRSHKKTKLINLSKEAQFKEIFQANSKKIYHLCYGYTGDDEAANDLMQETFMKVWQNLDKFRNQALISTWIYRIAVNESLTYLEQQKRRSSVSFDDVSESLENKLQSEKGFDENKAIWKLQLAVQQLPEKQRIVFNLRYFDEMPYEEMGIILDTSVGALKASYHHAVKKIEEYILNH